MKTSYALLISTTCQRIGLGLFIFSLFAVTFLGVDLPMNAVSLIALLTLGVGGLASAAHLARPNRFLNAFSNFKSHLTQEALITPFLGLALLISGLNGFLYNLGIFGAVINWIGLMLAVGFLVSTGLVYQLNARPAWDTPLVLIIFLTTSATVGSFFTTALSVSIGGGPTRALIYASILMFLLCVVAQYLFIQRLKGLKYGVAADVTAAPYRNTFAFWLVIGVFATAGSFGVFMVYGAVAAVYLAVVFSVAGILSWTMLFYQTALLVRKFPQYTVDLNVYF